MEEKITRNADEDRIVWRIRTGVDHEQACELLDDLLATIRVRRTILAERGADGPWKATQDEPLILLLVEAQPGDAIEKFWTLFAEVFRLGRVSGVNTIYPVPSEDGSRPLHNYVPGWAGQIFGKSNVVRELLEDKPLLPPGHYGWRPDVLRHMGVDPDDPRVTWTESGFTYGPLVHLPVEPSDDHQARFEDALAKERGPAPILWLRDEAAEVYRDSRPGKSSTFAAILRRMNLNKLATIWGRDKTSGEG